MKRFFLPISLAATLTAAALGALPSHAHGTAAGGAMAGLAHPLLGMDHLLMLLAVGTAASQISFQLLAWALGGGLLGALAGVSGWSAPLLESLAVVAIVAVAGMGLLWPARREADQAIRCLQGAVIGAGVALHALLHGLEAPTHGAVVWWWAGALVSSAVVCGVTALVLRRLPEGWGRTVAIGVLTAAGLLVLAS